jgi:excisionase family DNA binding protein
LNREERKRTDMDMTTKTRQESDEVVGGKHPVLAGLPPVLTLEQTAEVLQIGVTTARGFCREGQLPAIKVGRSWRIPKSHLESLLRKQGR